MKNKEPRNIKEKHNCVYCGGSTATFCGYWRLISTQNYQDPKKPKTILVDNCYAHLQCYISRFNHTLLGGVVPMAVNCERYENNPKRVAELIKIHIKRPKQTIKAKIRFLEKLLVELEKKPKSDKK